MLQVPEIFAVYAIANVVRVGGDVAPVAPVACKRFPTARVRDTL